MTSCRHRRAIAEPCAFEFHLEVADHTIERGYTLVHHYIPILECRSKVAEILRRQSHIRDIAHHTHIVDEILVFVPVITQKAKLGDDNRGVRCNEREILEAYHTLVDPQV